MDALLPRQVTPKLMMAPSPPSLWGESFSKNSRALGNGYGATAGEDEDGYITLLDKDTGEFKAGRKNNQRFGTKEVDGVTAICDDPDDSDSVHIARAIKGDIDGIQDGQLDITERFPIRLHQESVLGYPPWPMDDPVRCQRCASKNQWLQVSHRRRLCGWCRQRQCPYGPGPERLLICGGR